MLAPGAGMLLRLPVMSASLAAKLVSRQKLASKERMLARRAVSLARRAVSLARKAVSLARSAVSLDRRGVSLDRRQVVIPGCGAANLGR